jgi:5-methylcytosine-specific restriction endonuclease McrA
MAAGGKTLIDNLITACSDCNLGKGSREVLGD